MAGHSKWANVKHRKARVDAQKGKIFTKLARELAVAAREGGSDINANVRLRLAVQKARENNMPGDNIQRAIQKGTGELDGENYEQVSYEGYAPGGVALLMAVLTDNRNRTVSEIRYLLSKHGGSMGESGSVAWMFERKGYLLVEKGRSDEDEIMMEALEAGAEDVRADGNSLEIICLPESLEAVKQHLQERGISVASAEVTMIPKSTVKIVNPEEAARILNLMEMLESNDDIQNVYANFDIPEELIL